MQTPARSIPMKKNLLIIPALAWLLAGCAQFTVQMDFDPDVDFTRYRTFDWMPDVDEAGQDRPVSLSEPFARKRIKKEVLTNLVARGYEKVTDEPDFLIACYIDYRKKADVAVQRYGYPYYYWGRETDVRRYKEGIVILDFVDPDTNRLIWRGWSTSDVQPGTSPQEEQKDMAAAVGKILERFPPY